ncbi:MAG: arginine--tRNA ligase [Clostridia bacterium]|nr:arginine--tRNA ligase [Clostridia bacterium]
MSKTVNKSKSDIKEIVMNAAKKAMADGIFSADAELPSFNVETPADRQHGDYAVNAAMAWAKALRMPPVKIAATLHERFDLTDTYIERCEIAGPGFLNFYLNDKYYADILLNIDEEGDNYGRSDYGQKKRVLIEFVSANPTGPMHIGNARGGAIGDCLASVMDFAGYEVAREFYVNDAGNQIEKFKVSLEARYLQIFDSTVEIPEDAYLGDDIVEHAKNFAAIHGDKFVNADSEERKQALCDFALPLNIQKLHDDLKKYRIEFDKWFLESTLHNNGAINTIVNTLTEKGHTYEQEGAIWFRSTTFGEDKDRVLVRANGVPTYVVPDIAYHYNKLEERKFDIAIDVLGADHHGYVPRMRAALEALGVDSTRFDVIIMQMVRLVKNGETYKLSKRSGKAITLETLLDEIPIDAARFFFNLREPNSHLEFDLDLAIEQSSENPVYYVQYANARICSIMKNIGETENIDKMLKNVDLTLLKLSEERELIRLLSTLDEEIILSAKKYDPSKITRYSYDVATLFHKFYNACHVRCDDRELMKARLFLCKCTKQVICNVLNMLKITTPETM